MIEFTASILVGLAAHQSDKVLRDFRGGWDYISRYIVGVLAILLCYALMLSRLNRAAMRDAKRAECRGCSHIASQRLPLCGRRREHANHP